MVDHSIQKRTKGDEAVETDETLMTRFQQGDDHAFEQVVRLWEGRMLTFFYRATGDMDTARDLRQDLFLRLYVNGASYRGEGRFVAWLYAVATNLLRSHFRKSGPCAPAPEPNPGHSPDAAEVPDSRPTAAAIARRNERARLVRELLAALSTKDREVLTLRFFGNLRFGEISRVLGTTEGTARVRAYAALERLRRVVDERGLNANELL